MTEPNGTRDVNFLVSQWAKLRLLLKTSGHRQAACGAPATDRPTREREGARDFDFLKGRWRVHNRRLRERLTGSKVWDEFTATIVARSILGGMGDEDEYRTEHWAGFIGMSFRFFDPATQRWSIYWVDHRCGCLQPPVTGSFSGDTGRFEGTDTIEGRPILVRFIWSRVTAPYAPLGAGVLGGWRQGVGDELGDGPGAQPDGREREAFRGGRTATGLVTAERHPRRLGRSAGAVFMGFVPVVVLSLGTDQVPTCSTSTLRGASRCTRRT